MADALVLENLNRLGQKVTMSGKGRSQRKDLRKEHDKRTGKRYHARVGTSQSAIHAFTKAPSVPLSLLSSSPFVSPVTKVHYFNKVVCSSIRYTLRTYIWQAADQVW